MNTKVISKRNATSSQEEVYIGRPSKWGNPYAIGRDGDRTQVIEKFKENCAHLKEAAQRELRGKTLVCWCHPKACHGDVLMAWAEED